jgi:hypothetical protein
MWRANPVNVDPRTWQLPHKRTRRSSVIEMDMCQQKVRNVRRIEACRSHTSQQWAKGRCRPNVH